MSARFIMTRSDAKWLQLGVLTGLSGRADQTIKCILHGWRKKKKEIRVGGENAAMEIHREWQKRPTDREIDV